MNDTIDQSTSAQEPSLGDQVKQQAQQAVGQGQQIAGQVVDKARGTVKSQLSTQKNNLATTLNTVADALRTTGSQLSSNGQEAVGQYGNTAADQVARVSSYLNSKDIDEVVEDVNNFARAKPALFLGTALVLGIAAARFLKSSGQSAAMQNSSSTYGSGGSYQLADSSLDYGGTASSSYESGLSDA